MRHLALLILPCLLQLSCKKDKSSSDERYELAAPPQTEGSWFKPKPEASWTIQLSGTLNTSYDVEVYDVDLFDTSSSTIASLKKSSKVICYFSAGSSEDWRDDFESFPEPVLGKDMDGWEGERWLDIRSTALMPIMRKRLDLAVEKGCDAVDPDNVNGYTNESGFELSADDQLAYNRWLANESRKRGLGVALKNDGDQINDLVDYFDMSVNEQCHEIGECDIYEKFVANDKPVFNIEYESDDKDAVCVKALKENFRTLFMNLKLDGTTRESCDK